jgi:hypothetical protein
VSRRSLPPSSKRLVPEELSRAGLLAPLDGALAALSLAMVVTACALVAARL